MRAGVGSWQIDGFAMRPDLDNFGFFDNAPNHAVEFWGVYGVRSLKKNLTLDTYYPVSYTHLDVYKRQKEIFRSLGSQNGVYHY